MDQGALTAGMLGVVLEVCRSGGTAVLLVEFEVGPDGVTVRETFDAETTHSPEQQRDGWQSILNNFARHVENGG